MIKNDFFGENVTVSGLITGGDLINGLMGHDLGDEVLITKNMLRRGETVFLDNVTVSDVEKALGVKVRAVEDSGKDFVLSIIGGECNE
jgi:NifB/MoaA-like Fe-S oxidoreductase